MACFVLPFGLPPSVSRWLRWAVFACLLLIAVDARAARVKDISIVEGSRDNQLVATVLWSAWPATGIATR